MPTAKQGDTVRVHFTGTLEDGTVFDESGKEEPLEFKIGEGKIIAGFEECVIGMEKGETRTTTVPAENAYGERSDDRIVKVDRTEVPGGMELELNRQVQIRSKDGVTMPAMVVELTDTEVTLDANHTLAGMDLTFSIELIEIL